jgi:hypothetical protein
LDKNALAGKKAASAHLLLWICRRFSTDAAVLQAFCRRFAGWAVCLRMHWRSVFGLSASFVGKICRPFLYRCRPCHVLPEDKKHTSSVGSFLQTFAGWAVCLRCIGCQRSFVGKICRPLLRQCQPCHFLPEDKNTRTVLALPFAWPFQARSGVFPRVAAFLY